MDTKTHIQAGGGICGTCARPATATAENEGYSYCCNDRIEYGDEAEQTLRQVSCTHERTHVEHSGTWSDIRCTDCGAYA